MSQTGETGAQARMTEPPGTAPGPEGDADWAHFLAPGSSVEFVQAWFALLCRGLAGLDRAVLLLETTGGAFAPAARWPRIAAAAAPDPDPLADACAAARHGAEAVLRPAGPGLRALALPVVVADRVQAVLGLTVDTARATEALRAAQWGAGWLQALIAERAATLAEERGADTAAAIATLAALEDGPTLEAGLRALANEMQAAIGADRVAVALLRGMRLRLRAVSQTADVERRSGAVRSLLQAMEEGRVQIHGLRWPAPADGVAVTAAHAAHADRAGVLGMITLPLIVRGEIVGMISAERMTRGRTEGRFTEAEALRMESIAALAAPLVQMKMREHRLVSGRLRRWTGIALDALVGRRHPGVKVMAASAAALLAALLFWPADLRVTAPAEVQGAVARVATAPFAGYVADAPARAGDTVAEGDVLARLDDRDLRLDLLRREAERARLEQEQSAALAAGDRATIAQLAARIARVRAEEDLARVRLERIAIRAPFDGRIVEGDLSQRLGAPVEEGETLFRIAAGEEMRVSLRISDYDIRLVEPGATGTLALSGLSGQALPFEVTRIAEVATAEGGANAFRAEAALIAPPEGLRPGLGGVAKIDAGETVLGHALLRPVIARTRILLWTLAP